MPPFPSEDKSQPLPLYLRALPHGLNYGVNASSIVNILFWASADNFKKEAATKVAESDDVEKKANFEHTLLEEDSPYFEVRASVRNYDEDVPANTIRAWVIGLIATTVVSAVNLLFSLRNPSISIYVYVVQLLAYPVGCGMARVSHHMSGVYVEANLKYLKIVDKASSLSRSCPTASSTRLV